MAWGTCTAGRTPSDRSSSGKGQRNIWGYYQSVGLGYFEYFQFCEDIGAKPLPVVPAGVCCQSIGETATGERRQGQKGVPMNEMPAYVQEVLDLIEYANGPTTSTWGAKRAAAATRNPSTSSTSGSATRTTSRLPSRSDSG